MHKTRLQLLIAAWAVLPIGAYSSPIVFWVSEPVLPGQVLMAMGDELQDAKSVELTAPNGKTFRAQPLQASETSVKFRLPAAPAFTPGSFTFRLSTSQGFSPAFSCNAPRADWLIGDQGSHATPGGTVRVFGRCLSWKGAENRCQVQLKASSKTVALRVIEHTPYALTCELPKDMSYGTYALTVQELLGTKATSSKPLPLTVAPPDPWPQTRFNVCDYGAKGDAVNDDTAGVKAAIAAAGAAGGGVVYFPRGRYLLSEGLVLPKHVTLKGENRSACLLAWPEGRQALDAAVSGTSHFCVEDLTLFFAAYKVGIRNVGLWGAGEGVGNVTLRNLTIRGHRYLNYRKISDVQEQLSRIGVAEAGGHGVTLCLGGSNLVVEDCDIVSSEMPLWLGKGSDVRIERNRFVSGLLGFYWIYDTQRMIFAENTYAGTLLGNGGGIAHSGLAPSRNLYIANNTYFDIFGADREAITTDCGMTYYTGSIESSTADRVRLPASAVYFKGNRPLPGSQCIVLSGKGQGQFRAIRSADGNEVTLESPWAVVPDATSQVCLSAAQTNLLVIGNRIRDAGIAFQIFGASVDCIVAGNTCERAGGFHVWSLKNPSYGGVLPSICGQLLDNNLLGGTSFHHNTAGVGRLWSSHVGAIGSGDGQVCGMVIRGNTLRDNAFVEVSGNVCNVLVADNSISDADVGVLATGNVRDALLTGNKMVRVKEPLHTDKADVWLHPAEELGYQIANVRLRIAERPSSGPPAPSHKQVPSHDREGVVNAGLAALEKETAALAQLPATTPGLQAKCAKLRERVWAEVARVTSANVSPEVLKELVGLNCDFEGLDPLWVVTRGGGGQADLKAKVRTESWSPQLSLGVEAVAPEGWEALNPKTSLGLEPAKEQGMAFRLKVPPKSETRFIALRLRATLGGVTLTSEKRSDVGRREVLNWMVIGAFPNLKGDLPDGVRHGPEEGVNLHAEYPGVGGKVRWQPVGLRDNRLNLRDLLKPREGATAYAVTCLRAEEQLEAMLTLGSCWSSAEFWLNDEPVADFLSPDGLIFRSARVILRRGDNVLLCKTSTRDKPWMIAADFAETRPGDRVRVHNVPIAEMSAVEVLHPTAAAAFHSGGVAWRQVFADDFQREVLGEKWRVASGKWQVKHGVLVGEAQSFLSFAEKLSTPVRIEYDARSASPYDLSCFWFRDPSDLTSGYLFAFASGEAGSRIQIDGGTEDSSAASAAKAAPNKWYHVIAQVLRDGTAQLIVNRKRVLEGRRSTPPKEPAFPGLWTWGGGEFDNVRIYGG